MCIYVCIYIYIYMRLIPARQKRSGDEEDTDANGCRPSSSSFHDLRKNPQDLHVHHDLCDLCDLHHHHYHHHHQSAKRRHAVHPVCCLRFVSGWTHPLDILSPDSELVCYYLSTKRCLVNPTLGTNLGQRILAMRTGCSRN